MGVRGFNTSHDSTHMKNNIILIGMPGSGKSTVGIILAKLASKSFIDTDILIQQEEERSLQQIIDSYGHMELRRIEERVLLGINCINHVISTGGSAAYSEPAMKHLQSGGLIIFLHADLTTLRERIDNFDTRGLAKRPDQSFEDLFQERHMLYTKYADITVESSHHTQEQISHMILREVNLHL